MGEICAIRMLGPSHCFQRSQFASSSIRVRRLLQSLAPAPLVGPGSSMRRGKALPSSSMPKDRRGTCAWWVTPHLPRCCMTIFCAPQPLGITRSQWWVLAFISRKDGLPQTQLANELDVGKVAVGALIDRLESSGFVIRQADPVDRRIKRVYVTKQARGFLERLRKETDKFNARIVKGIDRKQLEAASDALLAMKHNLIAMSDGTETDSGESEEEETQRSKPRKKRRAAA